MHALATFLGILQRRRMDVRAQGGAKEVPVAISCHALRCPQADIVTMTMWIAVNLATMHRHGS